MNSSQEEQCAVTDIKISNFRFTWTINNFSLNNKECKECLISPTFCMTDKQDYKWCLSLYPKGDAEEIKDYISLYLYLQAPANPKIRVKVTLAILNSKKQEMHILSFDHTYVKPIGHGFERFIKQSMLFDKKKELLPDDKLTIVCRLTMGLEIVKSCLKDIVEFQDDTNKFTLSSDFQSLFENKHLADVTLFADGKELQAHKTVLAARSPVFLAMLQTDMQEKQNNRIEFTDVSADILSEMLYYLYTGTVKNIKNSACDLVKLADKYDIKGLKLMCEEVFYKDLSINSAIRFFILADQHNCSKLKPLILKFIIANAKDILKTVEFKKFEKDLPILIKEMMHAVV